MYMKHVINSTQWLSVNFWGKGLLIEIIIGCILMSVPETTIHVLYEGSCLLNSMGNTTHILLTSMLTSHHLIPCDINNP